MPTTLPLRAPSLPPKKQRVLTGRVVFLIAFGFFGIIGVANYFLVHYALTSFGGTEVDSAYQAGLVFEKDVDAARRQTGLDWNVDLALRPGEPLDVTVKDATGTAITGLEGQMLLEHPPTDRRLDVTAKLEAIGEGHYRANLPKEGGCPHRPAHPHPQWRSAVPLDQPVDPQMNIAVATDYSSFVHRRGDGTAHMELAVENITCAACMNDIEGGLCDINGIVEARLNLTNHRLSVDWKDGEVEPGEILARLNRIGYPAHPFESANARGGRGKPHPHAVDRARRRRFCGHECHACCSVSVWSRQCLGHDGGNPRSLPLAVRADCAAGRRLRWPSVLLFGHHRAESRPSQHGRADSRSASFSRARPSRCLRPSTTANMPISTAR